MAEFKSDHCAPVPNLITVTIRSTKRRKDISIEDNHRIYELKKTASSEFGIPLEQTCLVSNGSSLPSNHSLHQCHVADGSIIHLIRMEDGSGADRKRMKLTPPTTPFGMSSLGGMEGLLEMGLGLEGYPELQAKFQKKLIANPSLLSKLLDNPIVADITSDRGGSLKEMLNNYEGLRDDDGVVVGGCDAVMHQLMTTLLMENSVKQEFENKDFQKSLKLGLKGDKNEDKDDDGEMDKEKEKERTEDHKENKENKEEATGLEFMDKATINLVGQMIDNQDSTLRLMQSSVYQQSIKTLAGSPVLLKMMLKHMPGLEGRHDDDLLEQALPYFSAQLQDAELTTFLTNARSLQASLDIQASVKNIAKKHPNIFKSLSHCDTHQKYLNHLLTNSFSQNPEHKHKEQLQQLALMGFPNAEDNAKILELTTGDVNSVLQYYTQQQYLQQQQQPEELSYEQQLLLAQQEAAVVANGDAVVLS